MMAEAGWARDLIRDVADFPTPGVMFKDITPLLANARAFRRCIDELAEPFVGEHIDQVVGIEARGFILAAPVACALGAGFVPVRKPGKLPGQTVTETYELEYGADTLEVHTDLLAPGARVLVVDDVLATGGTAAATVRLIESLHATVVGLGFLVELEFLTGRARLGANRIESLIRFT
jgi:adenine phosphoribosyltransferase